jgi:hypothetical protein
VPLEIRQLVIKSRTISDDSKDEYADTDNPDQASDQSPVEKSIVYQLIGASDELRER